MERELSRLLSELDIPRLPIRVRSHRHGIDVELAGEIWRIDSKILDWRDVATIHPLLLHLLKLFIAQAIEGNTEDTVHKAFRRSVQVCADAMCFDNWREIEEEELAASLETAILDALARLSEETVKQVRTTFVKFYDFLEELDVPFYRNEFHARLNDMYFRAPVPHKGVMTLDPEKGPLSRLDEYVLLTSMEVIDDHIRDTTILSLIHAWGLRPRQVSLLNRRDFIVSKSGDYTLRVARIKQHEGEVGSEYKLRKLTRKVGELTMAYLKSQCDLDSVENVDEKPLFSDRDRFGRSSGLRLSSKAVSLIPKSFVERRNLISPVTGTLMVLSPRRLRETFGTRCAEMPNMTKQLLAEMLDHGSTRSLEVYFDFRESIAHEIGALVAARGGVGTLRDLTERFMGTPPSKGMPARTEFPVRFVKKIEHATTSTSMERFVPPDLVDKGLEKIPSIGRCGGGFRCGIAPLLTCYSCSDFEAWIEADHDVIARWVEGLYQNALNHGHRSDAEEFGLLKVKVQYVADRARELSGTLEDTGA
jgi:integrase